MISSDQGSIIDFSTKTKNDHWTVPLTCPLSYQYLEGSSAEREREGENTRQIDLAEKYVQINDDHILPRELDEGSVFSRIKRKNTTS